MTEPTRPAAPPAPQHRDSVYVLTLREDLPDGTAVIQTWGVGWHFAHGMRHHLGEPISEAITTDRECA